MTISIRDWVIDLGHAFKYVPGQRQLDIYEEYIGRLKLTDPEMTSLRDQIIQELERFPMVAQIQEMGRSATRTKAHPDAAWRMFERDSKTYAMRLPGPPAHDELSPISGAEAREAFMDGYREGLENVRKRNGKLNKPELTAEAFKAGIRSEGPEHIGGIIGRIIDDIPKPIRDREPGEEG